MRNYAVLLLMAISVLSVTSFAQTNPPGWTCPLKNLKKSQRRGPDGTAFIPGLTNRSPEKGDATKKVYIRK